MKFANLNMKFLIKMGRATRFLKQDNEIVDIDNKFNKLQNA